MPVSGDTIFRVQAGFSLMSMVFCMSMIAVGKNPTYYLPVLTSIIGYWLPSPQNQKDASRPPAATQEPARAQPSAVEEGRVDPGHVTSI